MKFEAIKNKIGYKVIPMTGQQTSLIGGIGICDYCGGYSSKGFLIPVLNSWYCDNCHSRWEQSAKYYSEDINYEASSEKRYLEYLNKDQ